MKNTIHWGRIIHIYSSLVYSAVRSKEIRGLICNRRGQKTEDKGCKTSLPNIGLLDSDADVLLSQMKGCMECCSFCMQQML